jgi:hypothetical protein
MRHSTSIFGRGLLAANCLLVAGATVAEAAPIRITVTNNQPAGGLYVTPLLGIFHDGTYDTFSPGETASAGVELIAEEGDVSAERAAAQAAGHRAEVIANPGGFPGAPVLDPGEVTSFVFDLDPGTQRFFSFLSMVIPSNDTFIGNPTATAFELFDAMGIFTGLPDVILTGGNVWDAGTEANTLQGGAFSTAGGTATETSDPIALQSSLDFLIGAGNPGNGTILSVPGSTDPFITISFSQVAPVPLPAGLPLLAAGLGAFAWVGRRRRTVAN